MVWVSNAEQVERSSVYIRLVIGANLFSQLLRRPARLLGVKSLFFRGFGRHRGTALFCRFQGRRDKLFEFLNNNLPVLPLAPRLLRRQPENAVGVNSSRKGCKNPLLLARIERPGVSHIELQLHPGRDLVDVLSARTATPGEFEVNLRLRDTNTGRYGNRNGHGWA